MVFTGTPGRTNRTPKEMGPKVRAQNLPTPHQRSGQQSYKPNTPSTFNQAYQWNSQQEEVGGSTSQGKPPPYQVEEVHAAVVK